MKTFGKILLGLLVLILLAWGAAEIWGGDFLRNQLQKELAQNPHQSADFEEIDILWFPLGLQLEGVVFDIKIPQDSTLLHLKGNAKNVSAAGVDAWKAWRKKEWDVSEIVVGNSEIFLENSTSDTLNPKQTQNGKNQGNSKQKPLKIIVGNLDIESLDFHYEKEKQSVDLSTHLSLQNIDISKTDSLRWDVESLEFKVANLATQNIPEDFTIKLDSLFYSTENQNLNGNNFELKPALSRDEFYQKYPYRKVQNHLTVKKLEIAEIDFSKIKQGLSAKKMMVDSLHLNAYQDLRKEWPKKQKPLLSQTLAEMPFLMDIDTVEIRNGTLKVEIKKDEGEPLGLLRGDRLAVKMFPFSNAGFDTAAPVNLDIKGRLMDEAELAMQVKFFPERVGHDFEVNGTLGQTNLANFNPILLPISNVYFKSGECLGMRLRMYGDDYVCRGNLDVSYRDLKVALPADNLEKNFFQTIAEGVANFAVIRTNSDFEDDKGAVYYDRDLGRPMVSYWWKSIESGLMDTMLRFDGKKDRKPKMVNGKKDRVKGEKKKKK